MYISNILLFFNSWEFFELVLFFPHSYTSASDLAVHESILRHCGEPVSLSFENDHLVVLSPSPEVIRVVGLLEEMHLRMLRQKCGIMRYISQAKKLQEVNYNQLYV